MTLRRSFVIGSAAIFLTKPGVPWHLEKPDYLGSFAMRDSLLKSWRDATKISRADARAQAAEMSRSLRARRRDVDLEVGETEPRAI